jgi:hypothetical protein
VAGALPGADVLERYIAFVVGIDFLEMPDYRPPSGGLRLIWRQAAVMRGVGGIEPGFTVQRLAGLRCHHHCATWRRRPWRLASTLGRHGTGRRRHVRVLLSMSGWRERERTGQAKCCESYWHTHREIPSFCKGSGA